MYLCCMGCGSIGMMIFSMTGPRPSSIFDRKRQNRTQYLNAQGVSIQRAYGQPQWLAYHLLFGRGLTISSIDFSPRRKTIQLCSFYKRDTKDGNPGLCQLGFKGDNPWHVEKKCFIVYTTKSWMYLFSLSKNLVVTWWFIFQKPPFPKLLIATSCLCWLWLYPV